MRCRRSSRNLVEMVRRHIFLVEGWKGLRTEPETGGAVFRDGGVPGAKLGVGEEVGVFYGAAGIAGCLREYVSHRYQDLDAREGFGAANI